MRTRQKATSPGTLLDLAWREYDSDRGSVEHEEALLKALQTRARITARRLGIQDTDDVIQDAVVAVWRGRDNYDAKRAKFSTWAGSIVLQVCKNHLGTVITRRQRESSLEGLNAATFNELLVDAAVPIEAQERVAAVDKALLKLQPPQQTVVELRLQGYNFTEIARKLQLSKSMSKWYWNDALEQIREG